ncbi:PspC domain-containing protein [Corynebacterium uterequi]|uniref:PspC domain-containing protein n=1 Tax=Corynebacterium uterequi TaxID=1072256 RepID=UPI0009E5D274|nr:PspC domain-containing protein [Corynebacterium uterequi]
MNFPENKWYRTDRRKIIAGVCAGVAEVYGVRPDTVRLAYVAASAVGIPMVGAYLIQWMIYPKR